MEIKEKIKKHLVSILENKNNNEIISKNKAEELIKASKGKIFTVTFIKKDGTIRVMNARLGVKAYLQGGSLPYDPTNKGLLPLFDIQIKKYRMLNLSTIKQLKINKKTYDIS